MKKTNKRIVSSVASIALCASLVAGASYALFTSESEVNIAVTSGTVDVKATAGELTLYSKGDKQTGNTFANGGTATKVKNEISIDRMTPMDSVNFDIKIENYSDVSVQYRTVIKAVDDTGLFEALDVTFTENNESQTFEGGYAYADWATLSAGDNNPNTPEDVSTINVNIEFPNGDNQNVYQGKSCKLAVVVEAVQGNAPMVDTWDGTADVSWYNDTDTEFELSTAEQLAGLAALVDNSPVARNANFADAVSFDGKTLKLASDVDLYLEDENGESICFDPIGSYRNNQAFKGVFDGNGYTIYNLNQNTWALNNGYYYGDLGMGLFGLVEDAHIKNLNVDGASLSGESAICGIIAGCAYGDSIFENITVKNSEGADYQYYSGGIVGWASGNQQYINCDVDASTSIAAQWGDFDNSTGGIIGGCGGSAQIYLKDCDVACRIDAYNDVTSSYQWYAYRRCGMLIGNTGMTETIGDTTYAVAPQLTCENVTVTYGEWANYTYCEFAGTNWPYVRVQAGVSNSAYSNPRYGHPTDANGNEVVDDNHVHNEGEDHQILCAFDQLYGGGQGVYGTATHDGVTVVYNNK